jgi:putative transposase
VPRQDYDLPRNQPDGPVAEGTVKSGAGQAMVAFLNNHREAIAAMDFFTVPTLTFGMIYCGHPTSAWVIQQLRETFPYSSTAKYLIFDRAANFNAEVAATIKSFGIEPKQASFPQSVAERSGGALRRQLQDALNRKSIG